METKGERFVTLAEAKKILEKKAKEKELGYEQKNALEHLRKAAHRRVPIERFLEQSTLDSLRGDPEFEAIVAEVKRRAGEE